MNASINSLPSRAKPRRASNLWPVSIIAFFVVFVGGLTAFSVFASNQQDDLVRADYYEEELRYQLQLDRINRTQLIRDRAEVRYDAERQRITIALPKGHATGSSGQIQLYRQLTPGWTVKFRWLWDRRLAARRRAKSPRRAVEGASPMVDRRPGIFR